MVSMELSKSWRGRITAMGEDTFTAKLTPFRGTPGGRHIAELPKSALSKHFYFSVNDLILVREFEDGSLKVTDLPWHKSPTKMVGSFLDIFSS